jgi:precorrin-6A/cobalt-precorrin-6A reductase
VRVLLLGGTSEARELAQQLTAEGVSVISSLAGRVSNPALPVGEVRIGGFGGPTGLADFLRSDRVTAVIDATHPFAAWISRNAVAGCAAADVPLVVLRRPSWTQQVGDRWTRVADIRAAADTARASGPGTIFLTTGRRDLEAFAPDAGHDYLVRTVDPPVGATPPRMTLRLDRGPYTYDGESALMREHAVTLLISKDSGGDLTAPKLAAARDLGIPVVLVDRPPVPDGAVSVSSVAAALAWLRAQPAG